MLFDKEEINTFCFSNGRCLFPHDLHGNYIIYKVECTFHLTCVDVQSLKTFYVLFADIFLNRCVSRVGPSSERETYFSLTKGMRSKHQNHFLYRQYNNFLYFDLYLNTAYTYYISYYIYIYSQGLNTHPFSALQISITSLSLNNFLLSGNLYFNPFSALQISIASLSLNNFLLSGNL